MKTILFRSKQLIAALSLVAATSSYAGLQIPYSVDLNTLHLYHFDGPTNTVTTTDEVVTASITLTNYAQSQVPGSSVSLGSPSAIAQLGTALLITPTNLNAGNTHAMAVNGNFFADTTPFRNTDSGAFTFEAIVKCNGNPFQTGNGNWEIVAGDNSPGGGQTRGWQFRIQTGASPQLNFNFITGGGGNYLANLPKSGPNVLLSGIWYHVAVTYTGSTPTNSDTAGVLTFYWTVLDGGRTNASMLTNFTQTTIATLGGTPVLAVGGSARNLATIVANGEGFKGLIDEVRISDTCRGSNDMAFVVGGAATPPAFLQQPPTNTFIAFGQNLSLPALVTGAPTFYWYRNGVLLTGQVDSSLLIANATFVAAGNYQLVASNSLGSVTSVVAQVTIGASFSELFNTGIGADGGLATANSVDPHYKLTDSFEPNNLGPNTIVWDMNTYPIAANGGLFSNPDGSSQWIGPLANNYISPLGQYIYRITFVADALDPSTARIQGVWWQNVIGAAILLNGVPTGQFSSQTNQPNFPANFVITNGFVAGLNTLDFVTLRTTNVNPTYQESAIRVDISGIGQALPAGIPTINTNPANVTVRENGRAAFAAVALGRPPLQYQWYGDNVLLSGATNRTLTLDPVFTGGQGSSFKVVISNDSGSITSSVASLTLTTNRPPVVANFNLSTYTNTPVNFSLNTAFHAASDADGDIITFAAFDGVSTNGANVAQNGINLTYTPTFDYVGADQFSYSFTDSVDISQGFVNVNVVPLTPPGFDSTLSGPGTGVVLSGSGGTSGGTYRVLTSTNLATPLTNWTVTVTGNFDINGLFNITNAITPGVPQRFYILQVP